jgi:phage repressor protein C with HTH and peptisase S24 domain
MAELINISYKGWQGYESGDNVPGGNVLQSIARLGFNINWLLTGEGPMYESDRQIYQQEEKEGNLFIKEREVKFNEQESKWQDEFVLIPVMQGRISAGGGLVPDNTVEMKCAFKKEWIAKKGDYKNMSMIRIQGDSMSPTLLDGDVVLVNHNIQAVGAAGGIYAITFQDEIIIKRINKVFPTGQLKIQSDNPSYESFIVDPAQIIINGKVIWYARNIE